MPVNTRTYVGGITEGMNQDLPEHAIPETQCQYIQDFIFNNPGQLETRGCIKVASAGGTIDTPSTYTGHGMFTTVDPAGLPVFGIAVSRTSTDGLSAYAYSTNLHTIGAYFQFSSTVVTNIPLFDSKPALGKGTVIGFSANHKKPTEQIWAYWRGANKVVYGPSGSITATYNSATVTGTSTTFTGNIVPGMFIMTTTGGFIGVVKSVASNTSLTLEDNTVYDTGGATAFWIASPYRAFCPKIMKGTITTSTGSTTVTGANTKFKSQRVTNEGSSTAAVFRARDSAFIGNVSSLTSDTSLTLSANAGFDMANERYFIKNFDFANNFSNLTNLSYKPIIGYLNANYAARQWYANATAFDANGNIRTNSTRDSSTRVWFSDLHDFEGVDYSEADGDYLNVTSGGGTPDTPITAIESTPTCLAVFKERELFAIYGSSPETFNLKKISDVGALSAMCVQKYLNGIIFTSKKGIHYFDGQVVTDLHTNLGDWIEKGLLTFDVDSHRAWATVSHDHYIVHLSGGTPPRGKVISGVNTNPPHWTICVNLTNRAVSIFNNLPLRGSLHMQGQSDWGLFELAAGTTSVIDVSNIFTKVNAGSDTITGVGETAGPIPYLQTKAYNLNDPERRKVWKELIMLYKTAGSGSISMETLKGLAATGVATSSTWPTSGTFVNKRIKFAIRNAHFGFVLYAANTITDIKIASWAPGYRVSREGRL